MADHDLTQADVRRAFEARGDGPWTVVYDHVNAEGINGGSYCALADPRLREHALGMDSWLARKGDGAPGFMQSYEAGRTVTTYLQRDDVNEGVELLVLVREFYGVADTVLELDQQFRLFHNLRYIPTSNTYVKMNDDGTQTSAVRFVGEQLEIRTSLLKQYIAARQMDLLLFIDSNVYSSVKPEDSETKRFANATYSGRLDQVEPGFLSC